MISRFGVRERIIAVAITLLIAGAAVLSAYVHAQSQARSLYARLGGYDAIAAVTDDFVARLAGDPQLSKFFVGHSEDSLHRIRQLVVDQLCQATGGPCYYIGRDMRTAHKGLGISEADWQVAVRHLGESFDKFKVPQQERTELAGAMSQLKADIVEKP